MIIFQRGIGLQSQSIDFKNDLDRIGQYKRVTIIHRILRVFQPKREEI